MAEHQDVGTLSLCYPIEIPAAQTDKIIGAVTVPVNAKLVHFSAYCIAAVVTGGYPTVDVFYSTVAYNQPAESTTSIFNDTTTGAGGLQVDSNSYTKANDADFAIEGGVFLQKGTVLYVAVTTPAGSTLTGVNVMMIVEYGD